MKINEILKEYVNQERKPREIGRYWASEIYPIIKGYSKPKHFLKQDEIDLEGAKKIVVGEAFEDMLSKVFDTVGVKYNVEKETINITDNIELSVRPDFVFDKFLIETKFPFSNVNEIPDKYKYQLEAEYRAFNKDTYLGIFEVGNGVALNFLYYQPSDKRWKKIVDSLINFDKYVRKYNNSNRTGSKA